MLVIACNTATALALDRITAAAHVPVVGVIEPGAEAAQPPRKNQKIVVIGTEATVSSHAYRKALEARGLSAREKACPLLVPLVEEGWVEHSVTEQVARIYLAEAFADGFGDADTHGAGLHPLSAAQAAAASRDAWRMCASWIRLNRPLGRWLPGCRQFVPATADAEERRALPRIKFFATDSVEKFQRLGRTVSGTCHRKSAAR